jgi:hypothetical protein
MFVRVIDEPSQEMKQWVSSPQSPTTEVQYPNSESETPVPSVVAPAPLSSPHEILYSAHASTPSPLDENPCDIPDERKPTNTVIDRSCDFEALSPVSPTSFNQTSNKRPNFPSSHSSSDTVTVTGPPPVRERKLAMNSRSAVRPKNFGAAPISDQAPRPNPRLSAPWNGSTATRGTFRHAPPKHGAFPSRGVNPRTSSHRPNPFAAPFYPSNQTYSPKSFRGDLSSPSYSAGASTIDSGPSTPRRSVGYSPALSKRSSFDLSSLEFANNGPRRGALNRSKMIGKISTPTDDDSLVNKNPYPTFKLYSKEAVSPYQQELYSTGGVPADRNSVDVGRIEAGLDTRTTVMLKVVKFIS